MQYLPHTLRLSALCSIYALSPERSFPHENEELNAYNLLYA